MLFTSQLSQEPYTLSYTVGSRMWEDRAASPGAGQDHYGLGKTQLWCGVLRAQTKESQA